MSEPITVLTELISWIMHGTSCQLAIRAIHRCLFAGLAGVMVFITSSADSGKMNRAFCTSGSSKMLLAEKTRTVTWCYLVGERIQYSTRRSETTCQEPMGDCVVQRQTRPSKWQQVSGRAHTGKSPSGASITVRHFVNPIDQVHSTF